VLGQQLKRCAGLPARRPWEVRKIRGLPREDGDLVRRKPIWRVQGDVPRSLEEFTPLSSASSRDTRVSAYRRTAPATSRPVEAAPRAYDAKPYLAD
jgi:hypothetical protein